MKRVTLTTDGACDPNPGPGGWAAILRFGDKAKEIFGHEPETTNNRMEMRAIIEGLIALKEPCEVHIRTDSKIAVSWCRGKQFAKEKFRLAKPEACRPGPGFKVAPRSLHEPAARPAPAPPNAAPGMIRLTRENLHQLSGSPAQDGFTRKQIELLGFTWPPPKGWLSSLIGTEIEVALYERAKLAISPKRMNAKLQREIALS